MCSSRRIEGANGKPASHEKLGHTATGESLEVRWLLRFVDNSFAEVHFVNRYQESWE